jgi:hypothetical protein
MSDGVFINATKEIIEEGQRFFTERKLIVYQDLIAELNAQNKELQKQLDIAKEALEKISIWNPSACPGIAREVLEKLK